MNLIEECARLADPAATARGCDRLRSLGLGHLVNSWRGPQLFGAARIRPDGQSFALDPDGGIPAIVAVAWDRPCPLDDGLPGWSEAVDGLVAFSADAPGRWWTLGGINLLGRVWLERASVLEEPAIIHDTPLDWLRAGGHGSVVLDWRAPPLLALAAVGQMVAQSHRTATRIRRALTRPTDIPEIRIAREVIHDAAA